MLIGPDQGILGQMKTQVTIPDALVEAVDALAERLGKSRDEVVAEALEAYLGPRRLSDEEITERLNAIFEAHPEAAGGDPGLQTAAIEVFRRDPW